MKFSVIDIFIYILIYVALFIGLFHIFIYIHSSDCGYLILGIALGVTFGYIVSNTYKVYRQNTKRTTSKKSNAERAWVTQRDEWNERRSS